MSDVVLKAIILLQLVCLTLSQSAIAGKPLTADSATSQWLTRDGRLKRDPVFWPGTPFIAYTAEDDRTGAMRLVRFNRETGEVTPLLDDDPVSTREFSVSADGKVYAYNTVSGLSSKIRVVDTRSGSSTTLPRMGKASWSNWACVAPNGRRVLFVEGAHSIYEYDLESDDGRASVRQISQNPQHQSDYWPRYSPSGEQIVFASNRDGDFEIYTMNADGTAIQRQTRSPGIDMHPSYSPDGRNIAFTSNRDGNYEIYLLDHSQGPIRLTHNPERDDFAAWHPDGQHLVVVSEYNGKFDLRLIDCR